MDPPKEHKKPAVRNTDIDGREAERDELLEHEVTIVPPEPEEECERSRSLPKHVVTDPIADEEE